MEYTIRKFHDADKKDVIDIFNFFIENTFAAYPEDKVDYSFCEILREISVNDSFYVIENTDHTIIGFGLLRKHQHVDVFRRTAEVTYFILPDHTERGLGSRLLDMLIHDARELNIDTLLANISSLNEKSILFHRKHGFVDCGRFQRIGKKRGKDFDVVWMQKFL
jgi:phosphinothricin acetyltransferase